MKKTKFFSISFVLFFLFSFSITANAQSDLPNLDIILVMDNSGSMKKNDPGFMSREVAFHILDIRDNSRIGLITFDVRPKMTVDLASTSNIAGRANILTSLDNMDYKGLYSDTPAAIEMAVYELKNNGRTGAEKLIILMTDGIVDTGDKEQDLERWRWLRDDLAQEAKNSGIRIFGVAFNDMSDFRLLQSLAVNTQGDYFRVYQPDDIDNVFNRILESLSRIKESQEPSVPQEIEKEMIPPGASEQRQDDNVEAEAILKKQGPGKETSVPAESPRQESLSPKVFFIVGVVILIIVIVIILFFLRKGKAPGKKGKDDVSVERTDIPKAVLIDLNNITGNKSFILDKRINMIGRDPNNDIVIPKDTVSSFHAIIEYRDGFFYLEDQRSMNKTILEGVELEANSSHRLKSGDEIIFNIFNFKFILPDTIPSGKTTINFHGDTDKTSMRKTADSSGLEIPSIPKAILVDTENITGKKTIRLKKRMNKIGRGAGNEVEISKDSISGLHATIEYHDGFFFLEDQRSKNRTVLGGEELKPNNPRKLKSGDEIIFDTFKFIFLLEYELPSGDTGDRTVEMRKT